MVFIGEWLGGGLYLLGGGGRKKMKDGRSEKKMVNILILLDEQSILESTGD